MEELGLQLNSEKFPRRSPTAISRESGLAGSGGLVGCLVGFSRKRERGREENFSGPGD